MKINWNNKYATIAMYAFLVICGSILLYLGISNMSLINASINDFIKTLQPFIIGGTLGYLLNFILRFYEDKILSHDFFKKLNKSGKRGIGLLLTYITASIITYLFIQFVLPQLVESIIGLANNIPEYLNNITKITNNIFDDLNLEPQYIDLITDKFGEVVTYTITIMSNLIPFIGEFVVGATSSILNIIIGIVVSIYILIDKEKFMALGKKIVYALCSEEKAKFILRLATQSNMTFSRFIGGKILDSFIIGVLTFFILTIFKMPYILLISVIVGVTNIIPFFGPFIGGIPAAIIILFVSPIQALWFVVIIIVIQQIDGNIIGPKILGDSIGISAFWILFSLLVAAKFMGFVGMVIGVPLFAIVYSIIKEVIEEKLRKKGLPIETEKYK